jgi:hypothetical protein
VTVKVTYASRMNSHTAAVSWEEEADLEPKELEIARTLRAVRVPYRQMGPIGFHLSLSHVPRDQPQPNTFDGAHVRVVPWFPWRVGERAIQRPLSDSPESSKWHSSEHPRNPLSRRARPAWDHPSSLGVRKADRCLSGRQCPLAGVGRIGATLVLGLPCKLL